MSAKRSGCLGIVLSTLALGCMMVFLTTAFCAILADAAFRMVPEPLHEPLRRWFRGERPDDPAFEIAAIRAGRSEDVPYLADKCMWTGHSWEVITGGKGYLTQGFGPGHPAIDIGVVEWTALHSPIGGIVQLVGSDPGGYGNFIIIANGPVRVLMAHLNAIAVGVGQEIHPGQIVAFSGNTGHSTGPHLHLEVHVVTGGVQVYLDPASSALADRVREACLGFQQAGEPGGGGGGAGAGGTGGGIPLVDIPLRWNLPPGMRAAAVGGRAAGGPAVVGVSGALRYVWIQGHLDSAGEGTVEVDAPVTVEVGPRPGEAWAELQLQPGDHVFLSAWRSR